MPVCFILPFSSLYKAQTLFFGRVAISPFDSQVVLFQAEFAPVGISASACWKAIDTNPAASNTSFPIHFLAISDSTLSSPTNLFIRSSVHISPFEPLIYPHPTFDIA